MSRRHEQNRPSDAPSSSLAYYTIRKKKLWNIKETIGAITGNMSLTFKVKQEKRHTVISENFVIDYELMCMRVCVIRWLKGGVGYTNSHYTADKG